MNVMELRVVVSIVNEVMIMDTNLKNVGCVVMATQLPINNEG